MSDDFIQLSRTNIPCTHERIVESHRLTGKTRKNEAIKMAAYGISNYIDSKIIKGMIFNKTSPLFAKILSYNDIT